MTKKEAVEFFYSLYEKLQETMDVKAGDQLCEQMFDAFDALGVSPEEVDGIIDPATTVTH